MATLMPATRVAAKGVAGNEDGTMIARRRRPTPRARESVLVRRGGLSSDKAVGGKKSGAPF